MPHQPHPMAKLADFLPPNTFERVLPLIEQYPTKLIITKARNTILGNYQAPTRAAGVHKITVNGNLNPYSFLVTLLHELAHLFTYVAHGHCKPHGKEWKSGYRAILLPFINGNLLPADVSGALQQHIKAIKASSCTDPVLDRALALYDVGGPQPRVEDVGIGNIFELPEKGGRFKVLKKMRTRYQCKSIADGRLYSFPALYKVAPVQDS